MRHIYSFFTLRHQVATTVYIADIAKAGMGEELAAINITEDAVVISQRNKSSRRHSSGDDVDRPPCVSYRIHDIKRVDIAISGKSYGSGG